MPKNIFIVIVTAIIITGCKQKKATQIQPEITVQKSFFPVTQYLLGQIKVLDSLPVTPLKITTFNGSSDSIWIKREEIRSLVQSFIVPVIDSATLHNYFSEVSFLDQSINAFTFSYDPVKRLPESMEIRRWDVYVDPGNNKVKRIYIVKQSNNGGLPQTTQLTWMSGYYCQITTITEKKDATPEIKEEKLIWNFNE